mmetsp:Transcript_3786/g.11609  ORF Transcript_3786/g.11609 Transcript_3786/m.11609 type:complete len:272 (-) Transcript_3786:1503-2318(-)
MSRGREARWMMMMIGKTRSRSVGRRGSRGAHQPASQPPTKEARDASEKRSDGGNGGAVDELVDGADDVLSVETSLVVLLELRGGLDEGVWEDHGSDFEGALVEEAVEGEEVEDVVAKAEDGVLFDCHEDVVLGGEGPDEVLVQGFHEARVRDGNGEVGMLGLKFVGGLQGSGESRPDGEDGDFCGGARPVALDDPALADRQDFAPGRHLLEAVAEEVVEGLEAVGGAARVSHGGGPVVDGVGGGDHVHEVDLVGGRHDDQVGHAAEVGEIE